MRMLQGLCLLALATPLFAQQNAAAVSSLRVTGESLVYAKPTRAQINVGVLTQERQSQAAATQNARSVEAVAAALRKLLGDNAD